MSSKFTQEVNAVEKGFTYPLSLRPSERKEFYETLGVEEEYYSVHGVGNLVLEVVLEHLQDNADTAESLGAKINAKAKQLRDARIARRFNASTVEEARKKIEEEMARIEEAKRILGIS